jgi:hypothetical protein
MANMCDVNITITANTAKTRKILRTAWDEKVKDNNRLDLIDYLHPENNCCIDVWNEDYYGDEETAIVGQNELHISGQVKWRPPVRFLQYLVDQGLSVSVNYNSEESCFCGRWEDGEDVEYYEYDDLLPEGYEVLEHIVKGDNYEYELLNNPVWERGELLKLKYEEDGKTYCGVMLSYEPYEFIIPDLPDSVLDLAAGTFEWLDDIRNITAKKKIKILMMGETNPDEAIVYVDQNGNEILHLIE